MQSTTLPILDQAISERPGGAITKTLQSQSPGGLAHSAICALRRGDTPTPEAQSSLDATLAWREAWECWSDAYEPWHTMVSRLETAIMKTAEARRRSKAAQRCVAFYGGHLGDLAERDAALRLRGAFAQTRGIAGSESADWQDELALLRSEVRGRIDSNQIICPDGFLWGDLPPSDSGRLPAEPLIAAWAQTQRRPGMRRAARRWATAVAQPYIEAEHACEAQRVIVDVKFHGADPVSVVGAEAIVALLAAGVVATAAGVRISPHQHDTIDAFRGGLAQRGPAVRGVDL